MTEDTPIPFFGREKELSALRELQKKKNASLVVIKGRRRIGKSRLAREFGRFFEKSLVFTGLPPTHGVGPEKQRKEFIRKMEELGIPRLPGNDWGDLFRDVANSCKGDRVLVVLDEISWMGAKDVTFLGQLKTAWDEHFTNNPHLIMILSGSQSTWIEENILASTGFVGRISYRLTLRELPLHVCNLFWQRKEHISPYEKFKVLAVTGGVPRYLEEIQPHRSAEENIKQMCFESEGLLFNEF
ncbi:MAG: ATPase, partial [Verrucomicrobia bacterium]|nr:ATPase [Verrucomicrobiota bacterium]